MDDVETTAENVKGEVSIISNTTAENSDDIETLQSWAEDAEDRITTVETLNSPPEGYLTGTVGNYTLHAKAREVGNYTANVNLVYSTPVSAGNATTYDGTLQAFYASVNWSASLVPDYVCSLTCDNTTWGISKVFFSIGTFALEADIEKTIAVPFGGLNSTYEPDFAYVEVYPVLR